MYIRCVYGIFGREFTIHTVIYGVYIRFWPTLGIYYGLTGAVAEYDGLTGAMV
jgi:hypothetical protein